MDNKERFISLCESINRPGIGDLLNWLEDNGFYTAPASSRFHGAYAGGLLDHSLNVYDELKRLLSAYPEIEVSEESVIICSLFHDLCKVNLYTTEKRNRKNSDGQWESYDAYTIKERFCYGGHGSKSVYLVQHFMQLNPEEAVAIQCHMSSWEDGAAKNVGNAFEQFPFAWLVHVADESATYILESEGKSKCLKTKKVLTICLSKRKGRLIHTTHSSVWQYPLSQELSTLSLRQVPILNKLLQKSANTRKS